MGRQSGIRGADPRVRRVVQRDACRRGVYGWMDDDDGGRWRRLRKNGAKCSDGAGHVANPSVHTQRDCERAAKR